MKVSFFLNSEFIPKQSWHEALEAKIPIPIAPLGSAATAQSMIYQTWFWLHQAGVSCELVTRLPQKGILLFTSDTFPSSTIFSSELFCVDVLTDSSFYPKAHCHLVQNQAQTRRVPNSLFVPHWSQPNLIPRLSSRGPRFENVSFFGDSFNLAQELQTPEWRQQLRRELGLFLNFQPPDHWHDYSETDVVLAIRNFSRSPHHNKPASKLYNAWFAGVPFIGGRDSAYAHDGSPGINYLSATSPQQVINQLRRLKEDPILLAELVTNGQKAGRNFSHEILLSQWKQLIEKTLPELALDWQKKSPSQQRLFWMKQKCYHHFFNSLKKETQDDILIKKTMPGIKKHLKKIQK